MNASQPPSQAKESRLKSIGSVVGKVARVVFVLTIFSAAVWLLSRELQGQSVEKVQAALFQVTTWHICLALLWTVLNYLGLIGYDWIGLRAVGHPLPLRNVALAAFLSYTAAFNFGALLGGTSLRYHMYSRFGLTATEVVQLTVMLLLTFWVGMFTLCGMVFLVWPVDIPAKISFLPFSSSRPLAISLLIIVLLYLVVNRFLRQVTKSTSLLPGFRMTLLQIVVASLDLVLQAAILYTLLPASIAAPFSGFLAIFLLATLVGILSQVPGALGVFEVVIIALFESLLGHEAKEGLIAALLLFRFFYYLLPLVPALVLLVVFEIRYSMTRRRADLSSETA